jgi:hypothetical protein
VLRGCITLTVCCSVAILATYQSLQADTTIWWPVWPLCAGLIGLAGTVVSNPTGDMDVFSECCVLTDRGLCVGLITRPEESYQVWCVWVWSWSLDNEEALDHWGCCAMENQRPLCLVMLFSYSSLPFFTQGDQKVSVHPMITVQKTRKNILNSFNHLPR